MLQLGDTSANDRIGKLERITFFPKPDAKDSFDPEVLLGPATRWDSVLLAALEYAVESPCPAIVTWGEAGAFCNANALDVLGVSGTHDRNVAREVAWRRLPPLLADEEDTQTNPILALSEDRLIERYFKRTRGQLRNAQGVPSGIAVNLVPVTEHVVERRRQKTLQHIAETGNAVASVEAAYSDLVLRLAGNERDFPFVALYQGSRSFMSPALLHQAGFLSAPSQRLAETFAATLVQSRSERESSKGRLVRIERTHPELPTGAWPDAPETAYVFALPFRDGTSNREWLVLGLNPYAENKERLENFLASVNRGVHDTLSEIARKEERSSALQRLTDANRRNASFNLRLIETLRTPLTLIMNGPDDNGAHRAQVHALLRTLNAATDIMSVEAGAPFRPVPTDVAKFTAALTGMLQSAFLAAGRTLQFECDASPLVANVDRDLWEKLISNLIVEAGHFEAPSVTVRLEARDDGWICLEVAASHRRTAGTDPAGSISFSFAETFATLHGGRIESSTTGGVKIAIPQMRHDVGESSDNLQAEPETIGPYIEEVLLSLDTHSAPETADRNARTILVCDDHVQMRRFMERILSPDFHVELAGDATQALQAISRHRPDLVILDIMLPGRSGLELLRDLRNSTAYQDIPVLVVTAKASEEARLEGLAEGADGYLAKPFTTRTLLARVDNILRLRDMRAEIVRRETHLRGQARRTSRQLADVLANVNDQIVLVDRDYKMVFINEAAAADLLVEERRSRSVNLLDALPEARGSAIETKLREAIVFNRARAMDYRRPDNGRSYRLRFVPVPQGALIFATNVTEQMELSRQVKESEDRFRLLANSAPVMIWMQDGDSECTYVNAAWSRFSGRSAESFLGKGWAAFVHPDDLPAALESMSVAHENRAGFETVYRMRNAAKEYRWLLVSGAPRIDANGRFRGFISSAVDITEERQARERELRMLRSLKRSDDEWTQEASIDDVEQRLQESTRRLKNLSRRLLNSQETEQARLARELHDQVGQALTGVKLTLKTLSKMPLHEAVSQRVVTAMAQLDDIVLQVRELSTALRPVMLDELGLVPAIRSTADRMSRDSEIELRVDGHGIVRDIDKETSIACFRIVQAALINAIRHSGASRILVSLRTEGRWLIAEVEDDGKGFDVDAAFRASYQGKSFGLLSMQERAEFAGGELHVESERDNGTHVLVRMPLHGPEGETSA